MDDALDDIIGHYEEVDEGQRSTSGLGEWELLRTQEVISRHLDPAAKRILDVGGALRLPLRLDLSVLCDPFLAVMVPLGVARGGREVDEVNADPLGQSPDIGRDKAAP